MAAAQEAELRGTQVRTPLDGGPSRKRMTLRMALRMALRAGMQAAAQGKAWRKAVEEERLAQLEKERQRMAAELGEGEAALSASLEAQVRPN